MANLLGCGYDFVVGERYTIITEPLPYGDDRLHELLSRAQVLWAGTTPFTDEPPPGAPPRTDVIRSAYRTR